MFHVQLVANKCAMNGNERLNDFIAGFVSGEGCFFVTIQSGHIYTPQVLCGFSLKVRADDLELIRAIWHALDFAGNIHHISAKRYRYNWDSVRRHDSVLLIVRKLDELTNNIIPFFDKYPLRGQKRRNYEIWKEVVMMMERGEHRTAEGFERVLALKAEMNRYQGQDEEIEADTEDAEESSE